MNSAALAGTRLPGNGAVDRHAATAKDLIFRTAGPYAISPHAARPLQKPLSVYVSGQSAPSSRS